MSSLEVDILSLHVNHPLIAADSWRWPLVGRLLGGGAYRDGAAEFSDTLQAPGSGPVEGQIVLHWNGCGDKVARHLNTTAQSRWRLRA